MLIILKGVLHCCLLLIPSKDRLLKIEGLLNKLLPLVENDYLLLSSLYYCSVQVKVLLTLYRVEMPACFHEIHINVNIYRLRFLALLAINYARVFVPAQVMHQLVFPFELLIIRVAKRVINFLLLVLLVLQHKSHRRILHTILCECLLKF